jgi:hypothetical protein
MIVFNDVMSRVKETLTLNTQKEKILDKDIANSLKLNPQYFAVIKRRNKIPYESLAYFSKETKINLNWLLLEQKPKYLT